MSANTTPIFAGKPDNQWIGAVATANTTADLTSGTIYLAYTADATNGAYVDSITLRSLPGGNNVQTVARLWINNGSTTGTAANNTLVREWTLPATTGSATQALQDYTFPLRFGLNAGHRLYVTLGTGVATGYGVTVLGGAYTL